MYKVGLIVNPIAGMGGRVGLKGTDGKEILERAVELGAIPQAPQRCIAALMQLKSIKDDVQIFTYSGNMGENEAKKCNLNTKVIGYTNKTITTREDTIQAAKKLSEFDLDLLIFVGGDGTARDIYSVVNNDMVVLGVPAGVKIHSAVYASSPVNAGQLARDYLVGGRINTKEAEVVDIDENAFRQGIVSTRLYGYLIIPYQKGYVQGLKSNSRLDEVQAQNIIATEIISRMEKDCLYIIGPGTTTRAIMKGLKLNYTLLGIDIVCNKSLVSLDCTEKQILKNIDNNKSKLIITPIGGQGYILGRGNQQISPEVITKVGKKNIIVIATKEKINNLRGKPLLIDTGDDNIDRALCGYIRVITGLNEEVVYPISY
ncbi:ATP-NAD kinase family protein [Clostridium sp. Cult2]|uniref:ATP-NAD kinase family protein n=1 Tax=Clostridium sp. Cult2 TaxID=2079003 RepID=UPI001F239676|nr:ATP-NAD kinase family protein [Clostridium sp. Cult2]MCF6465835.1 ATP-NAD kinase [Clostridium sp. Cult2]